MGNVIVCCGEGPTSNAPSGSGDGGNNRSVKMGNISRSNKTGGNDFEGEAVMNRELS